MESHPNPQSYTDLTSSPYSYIDKAMLSAFREVVFLYHQNPFPQPVVLNAVPAGAMAPAGPFLCVHRVIGAGPAPEHVGGAGLRVRSVWASPPLGAWHRSGASPEHAAHGLFRPQVRGVWASPPWARGTGVVLALGVWRMGSPTPGRAA